MNVSISNTMAIRFKNALEIIKDIECNADITYTEIANKRSLSVPTISNIVNILKNNNIVIASGIGESSGGRKPVYLSINPSYRHYIGVSIAKHTVYLVLIDFKGGILEKEKRYIQFCNEDNYWNEILCLINSMKQKSEIACDVGIALPGFVDLENKIVSGTETLGVPFVSLENMYKIIGEDVTVNDSCSLAAKAHIFGKEYVDDSFFVLLSRRVSGTLIYDRDIFKFKSSSIDIGSMLIGGVNVGDGNSFYEQCSASFIIEYLITNNYSINRYEGFFEEIQNGNEEFKALWDMYLKKLSAALYNIYSVFKVNIVIGGEMTKYIAPYGDVLNDYVNRFQSEAGPEICIQCSSFGEYDDAFGAALEARAYSLDVAMPEYLKNAAAVVPNRTSKKKK